MANRKDAPVGVKLEESVNTHIPHCILHGATPNQLFKKLDSYLCLGYNRLRMSPAKAKKNNGGPWFLYVLQCGDNTLYTGITNDLKRRIKQHNNGTASRYTRSRLPVALAYQEQCRGRSAALKKEYAMKQLSRKEKEKYIKRRSKTPCSR